MRPLLKDVYLQIAKASQANQKSCSYEFDSSIDLELIQAATNHLNKVDMFNIEQDSPYIIQLSW